MILLLSQIKDTIFNFALFINLFNYSLVIIHCSLLINNLSLPAMQIEVLKSKIHCARLTQTELNYNGSITIDEDLIDAANMIPNEKVLIVNNNNGARFETYIIAGERGTGIIGLNGSAARQGQLGDILIIMSFASMDFEEAKAFKPWSIFPNNKNQI